MLCVVEMDEEKRRGVKRKISLTSCDVCESEDAKYRCPGCLRFSCSLSCVKKHKDESGCSGVRDQTAFVSLSQFSELDLLNDYRFLEETARVADTPTRDTLLRTHPHHGNAVMLLKKNARAAKVNLKILPKSFSRRRENISLYIKVEQKIYWYLKLHFPQSDAEYTDRVPEDRVLEQILSDYIHPTESDPVKRQRLKVYVVSPPDQLCVFMKSEHKQPTSPKYHELDVKKSLRENLMFKTVVEYPELHVVLREHQQEYLTRFPGRKTMVQSSEPRETSTSGTNPGPVPSTSRDETTAPESLRDTKKRRKSGDNSDLEEGEIRSEEEEEDEDESERVVRSVAPPKEQPTNTNHEDEDSGGDDEDGTANKPSGHDEEEKHEGDRDVDQKVTMETDHPLHDEESKEDGQGGTDTDQTLTMETDDPSLSGHCGEEEDEGRVEGDQKVTMETIGNQADRPPSAHDKDMNDGDGHDDAGAGGHQDDSVEGLKVTMETTDPPSSDVHGEDKSGQVVGTDHAPTVSGEKVTMETADSPLCGQGEQVGDGPDVDDHHHHHHHEEDGEGQFREGHGGVEHGSNGSDHKVPVEPDNLSSSHDRSIQAEDNGQIGDPNDQKMTMETTDPPHHHC